jgi:anti-sigma regulatory factor (Ser/Thr protein kinase)
MTATPRDPLGALDRSYQGGTASLRDARQDVVGWLGTFGADEATQERAALVVSELASNAIQASPSSAYRLRATRTAADTVTISIRNTSEATSPPDRDLWRPADVLASRGRGLSIVDSLSDDVTVEHHDNEVVVSAHLRISFGPDPE